MPWIDVATAAAILATLIVGMVTRRRTKRIVLVPAIAVCLALMTGLALEGARPHIIALGLVAVFVVMIVTWARSGRLLGLAMVSAVGLGMSSVVLAGAAWALPPLHVPPGTGVHAVGIDASVWVDTTRGARGGASGAGERSLPLTIWYPAEFRGEPAKYLPLRDQATELTDALAAQYGIPAIMFDSMMRGRSNATWQGKPADGSFPVVIASPALGSTRWFSTSWAEQLASHGTVVIVLDHPYDSAAAELHDGTMAYSELTPTGDDVHDQALADHAATIRAADMRAVLDQINGQQGKLQGLKSANQEMIIAAGHSLGGAAAMEAARLDDRVKGVVNIDGMPRSPEGTKLDQSILTVIAGDANPNPDYDVALESVLSRQTVSRVTLDGITHFGLIDVSLIVVSIPGITGTHGANGPSDAAKATLILLESVSTGRAINSDALVELGRATTR